MLDDSFKEFGLDQLGALSQVAAATVTATELEARRFDYA